MSNLAASHVSLKPIKLYYQLKFKLTQKKLHGFIKRNGCKKVFRIKITK